MLRKNTGQANHIAGLLFGWRPFLDTPWAALRPNREKKTKAPTHFAWAKQVLSPLEWLDLFLKRQKDSLSRHWHFEAYAGDAKHMVIMLKAGPMVLGVFLL